MGILVFSIVLFAYSVYPYEMELTSNEQIYVNKNEPFTLHIFTFGGDILLTLKNMNGKAIKNLRAYLDGKIIPVGKWIGSGIGNHTLSITSTNTTSAMLSIYVKGADPFIPIGFLLTSLICGGALLILRKKDNI